MANNKNLKKELPKYGSSWWLPRILGLSYREVHWANSEYEKDLWQKLIDDFDTHKFDNYKDRIVVIKEV